MIRNAQKIAVQSASEIVNLFATTFNNDYRYSSFNYNTLLVILNENMNRIEHEIFIDSILIGVQNKCLTLGRVCEKEIVDLIRCLCQLLKII